MRYFSNCPQIWNTQTLCFTDYMNGSIAKRYSMRREMVTIRKHLWVIFLFLTACEGEISPTRIQPQSQILSVESSADEVQIYEMIEFSITLDANFDNPFDSREMSLDAIFTGPDGSNWSVPGFWDADHSWLVRFTPSITGIWNYKISLKDRNGIASSNPTHFMVIPSSHHGWLQVGNWVNPNYNPRYLAFHDGTPFYGIGHYNAFNLLSFGYDETKGFGLYNQMVDAGENILVYWPIYSNPFFSTDYTRYSLPDLKIIDMVVDDAENKDIYLIFTIWNHDLLRNLEHPWSQNNMGQWENLNGFNKLGSIEDFFTDDEAWAWQENLYRYIIARWGYSRAIGLWQTVSEIEGTNAGKEGDRWHERVNQFFVDYDPYRHPTTASMAGDRWWPNGYTNMDVLQIHSYATANDPVETGPLLAEWSQKMFEFATKPNFIGEFGTPDQRNEPEHLHNALWAGLVSGAALTPMDWNDGGTWGSMTPEMFEQVHFFADFVEDLELVKLNTTILNITTSSNELQVWGIGGSDWAIIWLQDISQINRDISEIRESIITNSGEKVDVDGLMNGEYVIQSYNTWSGTYLREYRSNVDTGQLSVVLPDFERDLVLMIIRE